MIRLNQSNFYTLVQKKYKRKHRCILKYGLLLTINNRKGPRYIRIYRKRIKKLNSFSMRFEYELKREALKTYQYLLLSNKLDEFEDQFYIWLKWYL